MKKVMIRRCPVCNSILNHTEAVATALKKEAGVQVEVIDGATAEFAVLVDGQVVAQKGADDSLPDADTVLAAVRNSTPVGTGA